MQLIRFSSAACIAACIAVARAQWSFSDGKVAVQGKGTGVAGGFSQESFSPTATVSAPVHIGPTETLKVTLTATENNEAKKPHQAFLTLKEPMTGLEESFPLSLKDTGRGKVELTHKDLPLQFLTSTAAALKASVVIASFGSSIPYNAIVFDLVIRQDPSSPIQTPAKPVRYGKLDEIHHIFRADARSPPVVVTLVFTAVALATLPALLIGWVALGANLNQLSQALGDAPVSHVLFFGSILGMEGIFFLYYSHWTLFQMLPAATAVGTVAFVSGSRALSEVQSRRLAGKR